MGTTLQAQVNGLINSPLAESKVQGVSNPQLESQSVFEAICMAFLLNPRAAYYAAMLAANGVIQAANAEIAQIAIVQQDVDDLSNTSYAINDTSGLTQAQLALIQMQNNGQIGAESTAFQSFSTGVSNFLTKGLGPNITQGTSTTTLSRPSSEAAATLPADQSTLDSLHADFLSATYALQVGVPNFLLTPIASLLGTATASRVQQDVEDILSAIGTTTSPMQATDMATRLIADRAVLASIGSSPLLNDIVLDSTTNRPVGYSNLIGVADVIGAFADSAAGPFTLTGSPSVGVTVGSSSIAAAPFPDVGGVALNDKALLISGPLSFPLTIPPSYSLFATEGGVTHNYPLTPGSYVSMAALVATLNSSFFGQITAVSLFGGTNLGLVCLLNLTLEPYSQVDSNTSARELLGYSSKNRLALTGLVSTAVVVRFWNYAYGSLTTAVANSDGSFTVTANSVTVASSMVITEPGSLGLAGTFNPLTSSVRVTGSINGVQTDPINLTSIVDPGDTLITPDGEVGITSVTTTRLILASPAQAFSGPITIRSLLADTYTAMITALNNFLTGWVKTKYAQNLSNLDSLLNTLGTKSSLSQSGVISSTLSDLSTQLQGLVTALTQSSTLLTAKMGSNEAVVINGILATLSERKYNAATAALLTCQLQQLMQMTLASASYGGQLQQAMQNVGRTDLSFPNMAADQGMDANSQNRVGV